MKQKAQYFALLFCLARRSTFKPKNRSPELLKIGTAHIVRAFHGNAFGTLIATFVV